MTTYEQFLAQLPPEQWVACAEAMNRHTQVSELRDLAKRLHAAAHSAALLALEQRCAPPDPSAEKLQRLRDEKKYKPGTLQEAWQERQERRMGEHIASLAACLAQPWAVSAVFDPYLLNPAEEIIAHMARRLPDDQTRGGAELLGRLASRLRPTDVQLRARLTELAEGVALLKGVQGRAELLEAVERCATAEDAGRGYLPLPDMPDEAPARAAELVVLADRLKTWAMTIEGRALASAARRGPPEKAGYAWIMERCEGQISKVLGLYRQSDRDVPKRENLEYYQKKYRRRRRAELP